MVPPTVETGFPESLNPLFTFYDLLGLSSIVQCQTLALMPKLFVSFDFCSRVSWVIRRFFLQFFFTFPRAGIFLPTLFRVSLSRHFPHSFYDPTRFFCSDTFIISVFTQSIIPGPFIAYQSSALFTHKYLPTKRTLGFSLLRNSPPMANSPSRMSFANKPQLCLFFFFFPKALSPLII